MQRKLFLIILIVSFLISLFWFIKAELIITSLILNSTSGTNLTSENLTAYVSGADYTKIIYNWFLNGASYESLILPFEGGSDTTKDYSPNSFDFTASGGTWNSTGGNDGNGAYEFNGNRTDADYIRATSAKVLDGSSNFTINVWIKIAGTQDSYGSIYSESCGAPAYNSVGLRVQSPNNKTNFVIGDSSALISVSTATALVPNQWYMITGVFNGTNMTIYVNGSYSNYVAFTQTKVVPTGNSIIGRYSVTAGAASSYEFNGTIDDLTIYNRSLSSQQIKDLYLTGYNKIVSQEVILNDVWAVNATPNNRTQDGTLVTSNSLTIVSPDPSVSAINLASFGNNDTVNDLNCSFTISDVDGGTMSINYTWYKNGIINLTGTKSITENIADSFILESQNLSEGENWICGISATDGNVWSSQSNSSRLHINNQYCGSKYNETNGNWSVSGNLFCSNDIIYLDRDANLTIQGNLTLENVSLIFNLSTDGEIGIQAFSGSTFIANNSIINSSDKNNHYYFNILGNLTLKNSNISRTYYNGLLIESDSNTIFKNKFTESKGFGVYLKNSDFNNVTFNNITLDNTFRYGLFLSNSNNNSIENNLISTIITTKETYLENLPHLKFGCNFSSFVDVVNGTTGENNSVAISSNGDYGSYAVFDSVDDQLNFSVGSGLEDSNGNFTNFTIVFAISGLNTSNTAENIVKFGGSHTTISLKSYLSSLNSLNFSFYESSTLSNSFIKTTPFDTIYQYHWVGNASGDKIYVSPLMHIYAIKYDGSFVGVDSDKVFTFYVDGYEQTWDIETTSFVKSYIENNGGNISFGGYGNGKLMNISFFYFYNTLLSDEELKFITNREGNSRWTDVPEQMNNIYWIERLNDLRFATDLDDSNFSGMVQDKSPLGSHGTLSPVNSMNFVNSYYGTGVELIYMNDSVNFPNGAILERYNGNWKEFTIIYAFNKRSPFQLADAYWVSCYETGPKIVSYNTTTAQTGIAIQNLSTPGVWLHKFMDDDSTWVNLSTNGGETDDAVNIVAFVYNGSEATNKLKLYINGENVTISSNGIESILKNDGAYFYTIGARYSCTTNLSSSTYGWHCAPKNTTMDFVYIFDKALTSEECKNITENTTKELTFGKIISNQGIVLYESDFNNVTFNTINTTGNNASSLVFYLSNNNTVKNNNVSSTSSYDVFSENSTNTFLNFSSNGGLSVYGNLSGIAPTLVFSCSPTSVNVGETISCSCSATDDVDLESTVTYTASPSTSTAGSFTTTCSVTDSEGNSATSSVSYTVASVSSATNTETSSLSSSGPSSYYPSQEQLNLPEGYTKTLRENYTIEFNLKENNHQLKINKIEEEKVNFTISSEPQTFEIKINETKKVDLDGDGFYDLEIFLKEIIGLYRKEAKLTIRAINEEILKDTTNAPPIIQKKDMSFNLKNYLKNFILQNYPLLLIFLLIIVLIIIISVRIKRRKNLKKIKKK